jgi:hypothetical protein
MKVKIEVEIDTDKPSDRELLEEILALIEEYKR